MLGGSGSLLAKVPGLNGGSGMAYAEVYDFTLKLPVGVEMWEGAHFVLPRKWQQHRAASCPPPGQKGMRNWQVRN